jgi:hypothetical protein
MHDFATDLEAKCEAWQQRNIAALQELAQAVRYFFSYLRPILQTVHLSFLFILEVVGCNGDSELGVSRQVVFFIQLMFIKSPNRNQKI